MEFPERVSMKITTAIAAQLEDLSPQKLAEINYGIAVFIANSYKVILMFVLAMLLNILNPFLVAFASFGALRTFASGVHAKREWTCLPASILMIFGIIYLGKLTALNGYAITAIFTLCFFAVLRYAPADTAERPIVSKKLRRKLKLLSCTTVMVLYMISLYCSGATVSSIITFAVISETALILPITYKLTGSLYNVGIINKQ